MNDDVQNPAQKEWHTFVCAYQFLTRIPAPKTFRYSEDLMHEAARYYPLVGALIGAVAALVFVITIQWVSTIPAMILSTVVTLYLTGAFHEDGFADLCDGIGGGMTAERALDIMKDSRLGTYGVVGLTMVLALKVALLSDIALGSSSSTIVMGTLITGHALSRTSAVVVIMTSDYVRQAGTAKPVSEGLSEAGQTIMLTSSVVIALLSALVIGWVALLVGLVLLGLSHLFIRRVFERKLQGYTGDCLGATQQMSEVGFYLGVAVCI